MKPFDFLKSVNFTFFINDFFKNGLYLFLALLTSQNMMAQTEFPTGLIDDNETYDTLQRISVHGDSKAVLPRQIDLKAYCPRVKNQGDIFSCVGWATGYAAMSIDQAIDRGWTDEKIITDSAYSALFIYNHIKAGEDCKKGSRISDAITFLQEKGNLKAMQFDFNLNDCEKQALDFQWKQAKTNIITDYETLFDRNAPNSIKIQQVKRALAGQLTPTEKPKPVIIGMNVRQNFYQLRNARYWWPDSGNAIPAGGHAMVVIGYNDDMEAFRLFNSWGKAWGDLGFIWVKYDDFATFCKYAYMLRTASDELFEKKNRSELALNINPHDSHHTNLRRKPRPQMNQNNTKLQNNAQIRPSGSHINPIYSSESKKPNREKTESNQRFQKIASKNEEEVRALRELEGAFEFRSFEGFGGAGEPIFKEADVLRTATTYETQKKDWKIGDGFQLWLTTELNNAYLYVFSVDAENKVQIHWPRKGRFNQKYAGMNESAYIINHAKVRIPGKNKKGNETVLYIENSGTDHLVVLFATKKIRSFKSICKKMQYRKENLSEDLLQLLGNHAIPAADIDYHHDKVKFEVSTRSIGYIVPLVLQVEVD